MKNYDRVCAYISLDAILENAKAIKTNIDKNTNIIAVVKTDAYGHGVVPVSRELERLDFIHGFAVATAEEALMLRERGVRKMIIILGYTFPYSMEELIQNEIRFTVFRQDMVMEIEKIARQMNKTAYVHIKIDTAMSRIGIRPDDNGVQFIKDVLSMEHIQTEGIYTHFAKADELDKTPAYDQFEKFLAFVKKAEQDCHYSFPLKHCANSAGSIEMKEANLDLVRAGIALYGLWPSNEVRKDIVKIRPVLSLKSHIIYIKEIEKGTQISYGGTFEAKEKMKIATIPVGYGDGYPRALSNRGFVLIRGKRAEILGRICMDQFMVNVSQIPAVLEGDEVTLVGQDGTETITMEELGDISGRFNYELACDLGKRIPRIFLKEGKIVAARDYSHDSTVFFDED